MTVEHRLLFGLSDILALTFECSNCGIRLSMAPEKVQTDRLKQCQSCGSLWLANEEPLGSVGGGAFTWLLAGFKGLSHPSKPNWPTVGFKLHFEFAAPEK